MHRPIDQMHPDYSRRGWGWIRGNGHLVEVKALDLLTPLSVVSEIFIVTKKKQEQQQQETAN